MRGNIHRITKNLIENKKGNIALIGDFFLDEYVYGEEEGISSSSFLPIFKTLKKSLLLGGAGNVANNLVGLGAKLYIGTVLGTDGYADYIYKEFNKHSVNTEGIFKVESTSNVKRRFMKNDIEVFREDEITLQFKEESFNNHIKNWIGKVVSKIEVLIISDYKFGVCNEKLCKYVINLCNKYSVKIIVDSRDENWEKYSAINYILPNLEEFKRVLKFNYKEDYDKELEVDRARTLMESYDIDNIIITKGNEGLRLIGKDKLLKIEGLKVKAIDTIGAGDTLLATLGTFVNSSLNERELAYLINLAGAISVTEKGTYKITKERLLEEFFIYNNNFDYKNKIVKLTELEEIVRSYKELNKKIVFTNGCFDLIHSGHIDYLYKAKKLGDKLIIAINSDSSVKLNKGIKRPIKDELDRTLTLAALSFVDHIVIFKEKTPENILKLINPDYLVKGGDYELENLEDRKYAKETIILDYITGKSTSNIIKKIKEE